MEKYGFVYIWRDRKYKRFYVGCHWGTEDDGYICSSKWMKISFQRRPRDFKRRTLTRIYTNKKDLLEEEYRWLSFIKKEELHNRYYNLHNHHFNHWSTNEDSKLSVNEKISKANKGKTRFLSEETKRKIGESKRGERNPQYGKHLLEETKRKLAEKSKGNHYGLGYRHTDEAKKKISEQSQKKRQPLSEEHKFKLRTINTGKRFSIETKLKQSMALKGKKRTEETKQKMSLAAKIREKVKRQNRESKCIL